MSHWGLYIIHVNHFLKSTLNEDEVLGNLDTLYRETIGQLWFFNRDFFFLLACCLIPCSSTVEPRYNEFLGTMKITLLSQVSHYIRVKKQRYIKSWDHQNYLVVRGFCYIRPLYNEVPLYCYPFGHFDLKETKKRPILVTNKPNCAGNTPGGGGGHLV